MNETEQQQTTDRNNNTLSAYAIGLKNTHISLYHRREITQSLDKDKSH